MASVLVFGAGPAGAALAYLLARRGIEVTLLERHTDFAREFRGEVLLPGGLEAIEQMGLWQGLAEHLRRHACDAVEPFLLSTVSDRALEWTRPGLLVIGDAAHSMSPVGAQGLNIALRDAIVAANRLVPVLEGGADGAAIDAAARAVQAERAPEVAAIQRAQALPPRAAGAPLPVRDQRGPARGVRLSALRRPSPGGSPRAPCRRRGRRAWR